MTGLEKLNKLKEKTINERDKAKGSILELRRKITDIEKEISFHEGERDVADYILDYVEQYINELQTQESLQETL
jgi:septal ring factor EnvC (AmiA/AmiB activator)